MDKCFKEKESVGRGESSEMLAADAAERLSRQLSLVIEATLKETWLPMGFRSGIVEGFPALRGMSADDASQRDELVAQVSHFREVGSRYIGIKQESVALEALAELERVLEEFALD